MKRQHLVVPWIVAANCILGAAAVEPTAPTLEQLRSAYVRGIVKGKIIRLKDGKYEGAPFVSGGSERPRVELLERFSATGNLDDSPVEERVAVLTQSSGGTGVSVFLAVFSMKGERLANLGTVLIGDRTKPSVLTIGGGLIFLDILEAGPGDAACCPTHPVRKTYRLGSHGLEPVTGVSSNLLRHRTAGSRC